MSDERPVFPGRASLQRYDRPASAYAVLIAAPLHDFPFVACWTVLGRPPHAEEWHSALLLTDCEGQRLAWMETLARTQAGPGVSLPPELEQRLKLYRLKSTTWGQLLISSLEWLRQWSAWHLAERVGRRVAGLTRYTYRHSRKWLIRQGKALLAALQMPPRKAAIEDVAATLSPEERAIFERLLEAHRTHSDQRDARSR